MMQLPSTPRRNGTRPSNRPEEVRDGRAFFLQGVGSSDRGFTGYGDAFTPPRKHSIPTDFHDQPSSKRMKSTHDAEYIPREHNSNIGAQELASALALASLASPKAKMIAQETMSHEKEDKSHLTEDYRQDIHTPRGGPVPVTPENISPHGLRAHNMAHAMSSMIPQRRRMVRPNGIHMLSPFHPTLQLQLHEHSQMPVVWGPPASAMRGPPMIPQMLPPPRVTASQPQGWFCDFCNVASFSTYEETVAHEEICGARGASRDDDGYVAVSGDSPREQVVHEDDETVVATNVKRSKWATGCVPLGAGPADEEWLSELNCYVRKHCVEAFSATGDDIRHTLKRGRTAPFSVGIRCVFCKGKHPSNPAAAVSYPVSMAGIYESVKRWQRIHLSSCPNAPTEVHTTIQRLQSVNAWVPTTRQYWVDSAKSLGMLDTSEGIRFERPPGMTVGWKPDPHKLLNPDSSRIPEEDAQPSESGDGGYITVPEDQDGVPPYVYFLMRQVEPCKFTHSDRFVARSKCQVGYPGFQCRYCRGHAGLGKYFPLDKKSLSTNSTSQNIHAHLLKCRKCPHLIKKSLLDLKEAKSYAPRLMAGWRRAYFDVLWDRIHEE